VKRPTVFEVAAAAGIVAFFWTLLASKTPVREYAGRDGTSRLAGRGHFAIAESANDIRALQDRLRNDPADAWTAYQLARRLEYAGQTERAREAHRAVARSTQALAAEEQRFGRFMYARGQSLRTLGMAEDSRKAFAAVAAWYEQRMQDNTRLRTSPGAMLRYGWALELSGQPDRARQTWCEVLESVREGELDAGAMADKAALHALISDPEGALCALTRAQERGFVDADAVENDESFASLRGDERFGQVLGWMRRAESDRKWDNGYWIERYSRWAAPPGPPRNRTGRLSTGL
jgi:tetratricopeptide (TPR) repeat protein